MTTKPINSERLRTAHLNSRSGTKFDIMPNATQRAALAETLGILALPEARLAGEIKAQRNDAWELTARLTGRATQACVVTLAPVNTKFDEKVRRLYSPHLVDPLDEEVEMPDDDLEPLEQYIDLGEVLAEALVLALPPYPRAPGAGLPEAAAAEPVQDTRKPFAGLGDMLKNRD